MLVCGSLGMIILHQKHSQTIVIGAHRMGRRHHNSPELVSIRDVDNILNILSGYQTPLDEGRSKGRRHSRRDERDQNGGLEKAGHGVGSLV